MRNLLYVAPPLAPPTADQVIEALEWAREIVKAGWVQRAGFAWTDGQPCYCLAAAITAASRTTQIRDAAVLAVQFALPGKFARGSIELFNDDRATVVGDVAWVLMSAKAFVGRAVA